MAASPALGMKTKMMGLTLVMLLGLALFGGWSVWQIRQEILLQKRLALQALVESASHVIQQQYQQAQEGKISTAEAQKRARDILRSSHYNGGADYFFIYDFNGVNIMHGGKRSREGKAFLDAADPTGKHYISDWITQLRLHGSAEMDYLFPKPGTTVPLPKISYAKSFEPWGWWLGTGVYIEDVNAEFTSAATRSFIFLIALVLVLWWLSWMIGRNVIAAIGGEPGQAAQQVARLSHGDLTQQFAVSGRQDSLLASLSQLQQRLRAIVATLHGTTAQLHQQSSNLSHSSQAIESAASSEMKSSAETAQLVTRLLNRIHDVSAIAQRSYTNSEQTLQQTQRGQAVVEQVNAEIADVSSAVQESTHRIGMLQSRSQEIGNITQVIAEIAAQINLLALNAAIEAARAGESGRGFAVVADEVRKLAERTSVATGEIAHMIDAIQQETRFAVDAMTNASPRVASAHSLARDAALSLTEIRQVAEDSFHNAQLVANANQEQESTVADISQQMKRIVSMIEETGSISANNAQAAQQLLSLSVQLQAQVEFFRT